jgi:hypothetical protein
MSNYEYTHKRMFVFDVHHPELGDDTHEILVWAWNWDDAAEQAREEADAVYGDDSRLTRLVVL